MGRAKLTPNKLLTSLLTEIGSEQTEPYVIDGKTVMITKSEAVARGLYEMATGGFFEKVNKRTGEVVEVFREANPAAIRLIREYTEGKPSQDVVKEVADKKRAGSLTSETRNRLHEILNGSSRSAGKLARPTARKGE
jgi:hypothetical protein